MSHLAVPRSRRANLKVPILFMMEISVRLITIFKSANDIVGSYFLTCIGGVNQPKIVLKVD